MPGRYGQYVCPKIGIAAQDRLGFELFMVSGGKKQHKQNKKTRIKVQRTFVLVVIAVGPCS